MQWCRLFYMHGAGQNSKSLLGQLDKALDDGAISFNMSAGEQLRDYLPVGVVASKMVKLIEHSNFDGVVNICNGKPVSVRHLVEQHLLKRGMNIELNLGYYPYPEYEPMITLGQYTTFQF